MGEAHLRLGRLADSRAALDVALEHAKDARKRAIVLGRIAWVHQTGADPDRAWDALGRAFDALGSRMPVESVISAATTSARFARFRLGRVLDRPSRITPR